MRRAWQLMAAAAALLLLAACAPVVSQEDPWPAPELQGTDFDGDAWDIDELRGSVVVVTVWASWCGPCRDEVPVLSAAEQELGPEGLKVLGVVFRDNPDAARQFVEEEEPAYPSVLDPEGTISVAWGVSALPQSFLVNRNGEVVDRHFGAATDEWIADVVAPEVHP